MENKKINIWKEILSLIFLIVIVLIITIPFKYFVAEPFIVQGSSMSPNFETGHYILINKFYSNFYKTERGDVLVFVAPHERSDSILKYTGFFDLRKKYIKRVIGLPGETIKLKDHKIFIKNKKWLKFKELNEPYLKNNGTTTDVKKKLGANEYFLLGDNRSGSYDSEEWGPIKKSDILGKPFLRIFPFSKFGTEPAGYHNYK